MPPACLRGPPKEPPSGLCSFGESVSFLKDILQWGKNSVENFKRSKTVHATPYEEFNPDDETTESKVAICSDLDIPIEEIKDGVRLSDANVFRIRTTKHGVKQKEWKTKWPYDFISNGDIKPNRRPIGKGVVISACGMTFYPVFHSYPI
ncbi:hypothetical protein N7452_001883 [Penicillium brevicompactum]|uniref:Uncharacterized protein n=1 Tax=Penicillium brevicompactum TaxID=5074 RepID=A0A9W9R625_PENBR|nr:hypothetical protein N7452_001883 [Penicillium brevicompactum]